jgi:hypothetical protein
VHPGGMCAAPCRPAVTPPRAAARTGICAGDRAVAPQWHRQQIEAVGVCALRFGPCARRRRSRPQAAACIARGGSEVHTRGATRLRGKRESGSERARGHGR